MKGVECKEKEREEKCKTRHDKGKGLQASSSPQAVRRDGGCCMDDRREAPHCLTMLARNKEEDPSSSEDRLPSCMISMSSLALSQQ
jgi:hypothetical protein